MIQPGDSERERQRTQRVDRICRILGVPAASLPQRIGVWAILAEAEALAGSAACKRAYDNGFAFGGLCARRMMMELPRWSDQRVVGVVKKNADG